MFGRRGPEDAQRAAKAHLAEVRRLEEAARKRSKANARRQYLARQSQSDAEVRMLVREQRNGHHHYTQLILALGYGGYFTLWLQAKGLMSLWLFGWTGATLAISILLFIAWELSNAFFQGSGMNALVAGELTKQEFNDRVIRMNKWWPWVFGSSTAIALSGGIPLMLWYVYITITAAAALPVVMPGPT